MIEQMTEGGMDDENNEQEPAVVLFEYDMRVEG